MKAIFSAPSGAKMRLDNISKISEIKKAKDKEQYYCFVSRVGADEDEYFYLGENKDQQGMKLIRDNYDALVLAWSSLIENKNK